MPSTQNSSQKSSIVKLIAGLLLAGLGALGLVKSPSIKHRGLRIAGFGFSFLAMIFGAHLFYLGVDDIALAKIGTNKLGELDQVEMVYDSYADFRVSLQSTFKDHISSVRRLHFFCDDRSKSFTVYNTIVGIFGVPDQSVQCSDGTYLIKYKNGNN